jgi:3-oxoadipate enol-lactonase
LIGFGSIMEGNGMSASSNSLWIERQGDGVPVVYIHGLGGSGSVWEPQVRALGAGFRSIRIDLNGSGRSTPRPPVSFDGWVADIDAALDAEHVKKAHFVGHSLGTRIVQYFAARHPDRAASMTLIGVSRPDPARKQAVLDRARKVRESGMESVADLIIKNALAEATLRDQPAVVACVREMLMRQDPEGYALTCEASTSGEPVEPSAFDGPVLLVAGREDKVSPLAVSESFSTQAKRAELRVIEQCGHWHTLEKPNAVSEALGQFLRDAAFN